MPDKVLVVDDDPNVLRLMSYIVEEEGYEVLAVGSGAEALMAIEQEHPRLVILDLVMPGVNGFRICERIRTDPGLADIKVLAVTGFAEPANMKRVLALGADAYAEKPLNVKDFLEKVAQLMGPAPKAL